LDAGLPSPSIWVTVEMIEPVPRGAVEAGDTELKQF
jgi:hypothetical protein